MIFGHLAQILKKNVTSFFGSAIPGARADGFDVCREFYGLRKRKGQVLFTVLIFAKVPLSHAFCARRKDTQF